MMSSADSYLLISTQTFVQDLGKTLNPKMSDKREVFISRILSAVLAIGALIIALYIKNAYNALMFCMDLLRRIGRPAGFGGALLEKSHQCGNYSKYCFRLCCEYRLGFDRKTMGTGLCGSRLPWSALSSL